METLDVLNLRSDECSFLETVLVDVRRYVDISVSGNKKDIVLVFPPLNPRKRFLIHALIESQFKELNSLSIGKSYGRRNVIHHSHIQPIICDTEMEQPNNENSTDAMQRPYRTPIERKAQEKLFQSLKPKQTDNNTRTTPRKTSKRPDIPIYVPKARRVSSHDSNIKSTTLSSSGSPTTRKPCKNLVLSQIDSNNSLAKKCDKNTKSKPGLPSPTCINELSQVDVPCFEDNELLLQKSESSNNITIVDRSIEVELTAKTKNSLTDEKVFCSDVDEIISQLTVGNKENKYLEFSNATSDMGTNNQTSADSMISKDFHCVLPTSNIVHINKSHSPDLSNNKMSVDGDHLMTTILVMTQEENSSNELVCNDNTEIVKVEGNMEMLGNNSSVIDDVTVLSEEHESLCPNYSLDDSFTSGTIQDMDEESVHSKKIENLSETFINEQCLESPKCESSMVEETLVKKTKEKKKKKKKVLNVEECSWEDLFDKEDDYIHPLLMKELVTSMGHVQVKRTEEDYRSYQTMEERSGDGECVIEVYGFSPELKTVDLMNQFAAFRRKHFDIVWVDDTHALAVFESPNYADQALNTPFALVKTRPLKDAIRESKLKAETIAPLPATRPKTCTAMARRLVSSALGLRLNVTPETLNAERTLLANAKEKKIRDAQQKQNIWNDNM